MPLIATNNITGAELAARELAKAIGPSGGKVGIIAFHAGSQTNDQRVQGFEQELKHYPKLHLVGIQYSQNDYNTALTVASNMLTANPDLKGFFAATEGWDTSPDEVAGVTEGVAYGLISQDPFRMG